jgi:hypothetical protein
MRLVGLVKVTQPFTTKVVLVVGCPSAVKRESHRFECRLPHVHRAAAAIGGIKIASRVDEAVTLRINSVGESDIPSYQIGTRRDVRQLDHSRRLDARRPAYLSVGERGVPVSISGGVCSVRARNSLGTLSARQAVNPVNSRCAVNTVDAVDTRCSRSSRCPSLCHHYPRKRARYDSLRRYGLASSPQRGCRGIIFWPVVRGGSNSVGRVSASQAEGRGFESRLPLQLFNKYFRPRTIPSIPSSKGCKNGHSKQSGRCTRESARPAKPCQTSHCAETASR